MSNLQVIDKQEIYLVEIELNNKEIYYLTDLDFTISKNKKDSLIFINENNAYKLASIIETKYKKSLGKVIISDINDVIY